MKRQTEGEKPWFPGITHVLTRSMEDEGREFMSRLEEYFQTLLRDRNALDLSWGGEEIFAIHWHGRRLRVIFRDASAFGSFLRSFSVFLPDPHSREEPGSDLRQILAGIRPNLRELADMLADMGMTIVLIDGRHRVLQVGARTTPNMPPEYGPAMIRIALLQKLLRKLLVCESV